MSCSLHHSTTMISFCPSLGWFYTHKSVWCISWTWNCCLNAALLILIILTMQCHGRSVGELRRKFDSGVAILPSRHNGASIDRGPGALSVWKHSPRIRLSIRSVVLFFSRLQPRTPCHGCSPSCHRVDALLVFWSTTSTRLYPIILFMNASPDKYLLGQIYQF